MRFDAAEALGNIGSEKAVEPLIAALKDQDEFVKRGAADALGNIGSEKAVEPLIAALKDQSENVRVTAAWALGNIGSEKAVEHLTALLKCYDADTRRWAADALGKIGSEKSVDSLIAAMKDQSVNVRRNAAGALLEIDPEKSVEILIDVLKDQNGDVRRKALEVWADIGSEKCAKLLIAASKAKNEYSYEAIEWAAKALIKIKSENSVEFLISILKNKDHHSMRDAAAYALGNIGSEKAVEPLIAALKDQYIRYAAGALIKIGSDKALIAALIAAVEDRSSGMERMAAEALRKTRSEKSVDTLIAALKYRYSFMRRNAAEALRKTSSENSDTFTFTAMTTESIKRNVVEALGNIGSEKFVKLLTTEALSTDPHLYYMKDEYWALLGNIGSEKSLNTLIALLKDQDEYIRGAAVYALGNIGSYKVIEPLATALLKDQDAYVRLNAVDALGKIGSDKAIEPLMTAIFKDQDCYVKMNAVLAVGKISDDKKTTDAVTKIYAEPEEKPDIILCNGCVSAPDVRLAAACVLLKYNMIDEDGLNLIRNRIESRNAEDRKEIAGFLGRVPSKQGTDFLISMLKDNSPEVREEAAKSLAESGFPEIFEPLKAIAVNRQEPVPIRLAAINGLGKIKSDGAVNLLADILEKETENCQFAAVQAFGNTGSLKAVPVLLNHLQELENIKSEWRKIRDENTEAYTKDKKNDWHKRLESVKPKAYLECEIAFAISRIAPGTEGIKLLNHNLAAVREGAWMGISKSGTVELLKKLYEERRKKDITPWFRYSAYRAMDNVLIHLESFGKEKDAQKLETFLANVSEKEEPGVHTRVKWTLDRLKN